MPTPKTVSKDIGDQLRRIHWRGRMIAQNSAEYCALDREIRKMIKVDPVAAYGNLGGLSYLAGDVEATHRNYENALKLTGDLMVRHNYAVALANLGLFSEVLRFLPMLENPANGFLEVAVYLNIECGRFHQAAKLIALWNSLHTEAPMDIDEISRAAQLLERAGITNDGLIPCLELLGAVLRENGLIFLQEPLVNCVKDDHIEQVFVQFLVACDPKETVRLESLLVDRLFDSGIALYESTIRFGFSSAQQLAQKVA